MLIPWLLTTSETLLQTLKGTWELRASCGPELRQKQRLWDWQAAGNGPWSRGSIVKRFLGLDEGSMSHLPSYAVTSTSAVLLCFLRTQKASLFLNAPSLETSSSKGVGSKHPFMSRGQWRTMPSWTPVSLLPEKGESVSRSVMSDSFHPHG